MDQNRCGAEFLRSPLASRPEFALQAEPFFTKQARGHLTAVAIAVENDHTVAFVGNTMGEVLKVGVTKKKRSLKLMVLFELAGTHVVGLNASEG